MGRSGRHKGRLEIGLSWIKEKQSLWDRQELDAHAKIMNTRLSHPELKLANETRRNQNLDSDTNQVKRETGAGDEWSMWLGHVTGWGWWVE